MRKLKRDAVGRGVVDVGTDGGAEGRDWLQRTAWGVVVAPSMPRDEQYEKEESCGTGRARGGGLLTSSELKKRREEQGKRSRNEKRKQREAEQDLDSGVHFGCGDCVAGLDQTVWRGEVEEMLQALRAAKCAGVNCHIIVGNSAVLMMLQSALANDWIPPRVGYGHWREMRTLAEWMDHTAKWCPSHGKKEHWQPTGGARSAKGCRKLNDAADKECSKALKEAVAARKELSVEITQAMAWSDAAVAATEAGSKRYETLMKSRVEVRGGSHLLEEEWLMELGAASGVVAQGGPSAKAAAIPNVVRRRINGKQKGSGAVGRR